MSTNIYSKTNLFYSLSTILAWFFCSVATVIAQFKSTTNYLEILVFIFLLAGLASPFLIVSILVFRNKELRFDLGTRILNIRDIKPTFLILSCIFMPMSVLLSLAISMIFGLNIAQFAPIESLSISSGILPGWFVFFLLPVLYGLSWYTYGINSLRMHYNLFNTSIIFTLFWIAWHTPFLLMVKHYQIHVFEPNWINSITFLLNLFPFVLITNWIYYKSRRNVLVPIVFYLSSVYFNVILANHILSKVFLSVILIFFSVYIISNDRLFFFKKGFLLSKEIHHRLPITKSIKLLSLILFLSSSTLKLNAQDISQTIKGTVYDEVTKKPLPFATIVIKNSQPVLGTVSDVDGHFSLEKVKVGRHTIYVSMLGYASYEIKELLVSSGQIMNLNIALQPTTSNLAEVVVKVNKASPLNSMATLSARQFTVEETQRYAGGMDDPARLVTSFAGVANPSVSDNGISIRGNNPDGLLWRIEGIEVPNPNHFANLTIAGGGLMSAISNQMMANSDFYLGAFPAEYGNALSGVFDIKLRNGIQTKQHALEVGLLGIGGMTQGAFGKNSEATYIVNYRNSTMALLAPLLPNDAGILKYQDVAFKTIFPTKKFGTFSIWGIGTLDGVDSEAVDSVHWESNFDRDNSQTQMYMYATALTHKMSLSDDLYINSSLAFTGSGLDFKEERLAYDLTPYPQSKAINNSSSVSVKSEITKRFNTKHSNKSGFRYSHHYYNLNVGQSQFEGEAPEQIAKQKGNTGLVQLFTQSKISLSSKLILNAGVNAQFLLLNKDFSIEPRIGIKYHINPGHSLGFGYGIHSRTEQLSVYFANVNDNQPNKGLDFIKSSHYIFSYKAKINENLSFTIEPYYQKLTNIPVSPTGYISTINNNNNLFFNDALLSKGTGQNIGVDITLERYLSKGYYYLLSTSFFDSKYVGADGVKRNTRYNRNYIVNLLLGKEWQVRRNNLISANIKASYLGGNRIEPIDIESSLSQKDIVYGETNGELAFSKKHEDIPVVSLTLSFRKNKPKYSSVWSLQVLNLTESKEYSKDFYNIKNNTLDTKYEGIMIPSLSYKIEF